MGGKNSPESINRYMAKAYDRINILVPKGQKDTIKAHAERQGESLSGFINRAIGHEMERDNAAHRAADCYTDAKTDAKEEAEE